MAKKNPEVLLLELVDKRSSGFIMEGTENTPNPQEKNCPSVFWIPTMGMMLKPDENGVLRNVPIRYIKGCDEIVVAEQEKRGIKPNPKADKIMFKEGFGTIVKEGDGYGLHEYLVNAGYYEDNPNRSPNSTPIYREIKLNKIAEEIIEADEYMKDVLVFLSSLRSKRGSEVVYNEEKIDALCQLLAVYAITPALKLTGIANLAKARPEWFLKTVKSFEGQLQSEITHALQLNVIKIEGTVVSYLHEDKILKTFGSDKLKREEVISRLVDYLGTGEGQEALTGLRIALAAAKEKSLKTV